MKRLLEKQTFTGLDNCSTLRRKWSIDFLPYHGKTWAILPCLQLFTFRPNFVISLSWLRWDLRLLSYIPQNDDEDVSKKNHEIHSNQHR